MLFVIQALYLMLPAYLANMTPVLVKKLNLLNYPVDFKKTLNKKRILGSHKTWRGLIFGILAGLITAYLQFLLSNYHFFYNLSFLNYSHWLTIGFLLGAGALVGDLVKSFIKRRVDVKPGKSFFPWDQIDYSIGSLLFLSIIFIPSLNLIITIILINIILHIFANHLAYYLGLSKVKW